MTKFPKSWVSANAALERQQDRAAINARVDMSAEVAGQGKCPECRRDMEVVIAGESRVWACASDRITLPIPNGYEG